MNSLSFTTDMTEFGLFFILLIDGIPIQDILELDELGIPFWLIDKGLPRFLETSDNNVFLVSVCGCGQKDCGHTRCVIEHLDNVVIFKRFMGERNHQRPDKEFIFAAKQFANIEKMMVNLAQQEKQCLK